MSFKIAFAKGDKTDIRLYPVEYSSFQEFAQFFRYPVPGKKGTAGYFIRGGDLEFYTTHATSSGQIHTNIYPRIDAALKSATVIVLDVDKGSQGTAPHLLEVSQKLQLLNINHFGYTSSSHTETQPKCRVVIPCIMPDKSYLSPTIIKLHAMLNSVGCFPLAGGSEESTWSNPWFISTEHDDPYFVEFYGGNSFAAVPGQQQQQQQQQQQPGSSTQAKTYGEMVDIIIQGQANTGLHEATRNFAYMLSMDGVQPAMTKTLLKALMKGYDLTDPRQKENVSVINRVVDSMATKAAGTMTDWEHPVQLPGDSELYEAIPFPKEFLPHSIRDAAQAIASFCLMDEDDILPILLVVICMSINRKAVLQAGVAELEVFFCMSIFCIAKSGRFKSTVFDLALQGFKAGDHKLMDEYKKNATKKALIIKRLEKEIHREVKVNKDQEVCLNDILAGISDKSELIEEYDRKRLERVPGVLIDDVTQERSIVKCFMAGGATNFVAEEGQGILTSWSDKYHKGKSSNDFALRGMSCSEYRYDRKSSSEIVFRPVISSIIFVQPDIYETQFLGNPHIYSSGMAARVVPIYWQDPDYANTGKTLENVDLDTNKLSEYNNIVKDFTAFDVDTVETGYDTGEPESPNLIKPVTKIIADPQQKESYIELFNSVWKRYDKGNDLEGKNELLNKCITLGHVMAGSVYAYEHQETFFHEPEHKPGQLHLNCIKSFVEYLILKKKQEFEVKEKSEILHAAQKMLNTMLTSKDSIFIDGIEDYKFRNRFKAHGADSTDQHKADIFDSACTLLHDYHHLKYKGGRVFVNPKSKLTMLR